MSIRLASHRIPNGRDAASVRKWAMVFLSMGIIGQGIIQNGLLNLNTLTGDELVSAMDASPMVTTLVTIALACKVVETCAAPLFAFLLVEGFRRTTSFEKYLVRIGGLAIVSEIPYNLAYGGKLLDLGSRNPVFGLFIALVMLFFFNRYSEKGFKNTAIKLLIFAAAFLWCQMLGISQGICLVTLTAILWLGRNKGDLRALYAFVGAMLCTVFSTYYMGSCLSSIMLHRYNGERGEQNVKLNYGFYPAVLLLVGIVSLFIG